jgi:hypothetical protein
VHRELGPLNSGGIDPEWHGSLLARPADDRHWGLPDPAAALGSEVEQRLAFADAFRMLSNRISIFVNLPMTTLDRISLQSRLDAIGTTQPEAAAL